ncbi:MAG: hypothetical protein HZB30_12585 [Nitrospirae bacterium]|nr:hypothetical protein [Nitrospirota bacterium]
MVLHFAEITDEDKFIRLEHKCTKIRKTLMGTLLLAKDLYKDELLKSREGEEVQRVLEEVEEAFVDTSLTNRFSRLENVLNVIQKRAQGLFMLMEYLSKK